MIFNLVDFINLKPLSKYKYLHDLSQPSLLEKIRIFLMLLSLSPPGPEN